jgi:ADP-heptose:LPS heptosyltransferase
MSGESGGESMRITLLHGRRGLKHTSPWIEAGADRVRILIVKLSSLGDLFHALPTVRRLKEGLSAQVDWAVHPDYAPLVRCFPDVTETIEVPRRRWWRQAPGTVAQLRRRPYDLAVDLQGLFKSALVCRLARAARRVGPSYWREFARLAYDEVPGPANRDRHAVEQAFDVLPLLGLNRPQEPVFRVAFPDVALPGSALKIGLLPVSRWPTKNWPEERYGELTGRLEAELGATVFVFGSGADAAVGTRICAAAGGDSRNLCGQLTLPELGGALRRLNLLIANDTGPVHAAAAAGCRCLVLFGPTAPERTGPFGKGHRVLRRDLPCQPCFARRCTVGGTPCLHGIAVQDVVDAARDMLRPG